MPCADKSLHPAKLLGSAPCQRPPHSHKHTKPWKQTEQIFPMYKTCKRRNIFNMKGTFLSALLLWHCPGDYLFPRQYKSPSVAEKVRRKTEFQFWPERSIRNSTARDLLKHAKFSVN